MKNNVQTKQVHVQKKEHTIVILGKVSELTLGSWGTLLEGVKVRNLITPIK